MADRLLTFCIDIDGVLCEDGSYPNYHLAAPKQEYIKKVRKLYKAGHRIVLFSARYFSDQDVTITWLRRYRIPFHKLILDKPSADIYVDDRGVSLLDWLVTTY